MIQRFADWLVYGIFGLDATTSLGIAVNFFFYDSIKIIILLFVISFVMGIINAYFPVERLRNYLTTHKLYGLDYFLAALFGGIRLEGDKYVEICVIRLGNVYIKLKFRHNKHSTRHFDTVIISHIFTQFNNKEQTRHT